MNGGARQRYLALVRGEARGAWPALQRLALRAAALPYGAAVRLRNLAYDRGWRRAERAAVPVVSVGNLTVGGTGKTPCVEYVARLYRERGLRVAVLSRGYGSDAGPNDEALVLEENLPDVPHLQGADRAALARDLDLVLLDASEPWGHGHLLPRGLLREPPSALRRAGAVLLTRCDQVSAEQCERLRQRVARLAPDVLVAETTHQPVGLVNSDGDEAPLDLLREAPVAAFCGIGNPEAFRRTLADLGADVCPFRTYPDHHAYTRADVEELRAWVRPLPGSIVVTTQKDLVKLHLPRLGDRPLWALRVRLHVEAGQDALDDQLLSALPAPGPEPGGPAEG